MTPRTIALSVLCLLSSISPITLFAKMPEDAIVRIVATLNTGVPSVGTGTVISADGRIVTCYHVVRDAKSIDISFAKRQDDLQAHVISISPEFDLAMLQLDGAPLVRAFLPAKDLAPSVFVDRTTSFGYPANFSYSLDRIAVDAINSDYTSSGQLRTDNGKGKLFTDPDRELITFTSVINNGASGSPLLFNGNVVGVISGSWSIRGSGAWAIPMMYLSKLRPPAPDERGPGRWPAVNLLKNNA
jgi:S1-C subfamily serine protease